MLDIIGQQAKAASYQLGICSTEQKNTALLQIADELHQARERLLAENQKDIKLAQQNNISEAMLDRLLLTEARITQIIHDIHNVINLADPIGEIIEQKELPNGLSLTKKRVPLGVIAAIYESRPNVTIDIAALSLKTGNAVILRGGKETAHTNTQLIELIQIALKKTELPQLSVQFVHDPDRLYLAPLLKLDQYVDMVIPRGGAGLQRLCQEQATIPVILGGIGVCHLFVDATADLNAALDIIENAKVQRPSTCNSLETLLLHRDIATQFLPNLLEHLSNKGVTLHLSTSDLESIPQTVVAKYRMNLKPLDEEQLSQEWLSLNLNVVLVDNITAAISHIRKYGSAHSDAILTKDHHNAAIFTAQIDSAAVYVNCSTRFTDGAQFGLGAEVAISTQKLHARGPMGLEALTSYKWIGYGDNLVRS